MQQAGEDIQYRQEDCQEDNTPKDIATPEPSTMPPKPLALLLLDLGVNQRHFPWLGLETLDVGASTWDEPSQGT
jgi:hypothetical protein